MHNVVLVGLTECFAENSGLLPKDRSVGTEGRGHPQIHKISLHDVVPLYVRVVSLVGKLKLARRTGTRPLEL